LDVLTTLGEILQVIQAINHLILINIIIEYNKLESPEYKGGAVNPMAFVLAFAKMIFSMYHYSVLKRQRNLVKIGLFPFESDFD